MDYTTMTHEELVANRDKIRSEEKANKIKYESTQEYKDMKKFFEGSSYDEVLSTLKSLGDDDTTIIVEPVKCKKSLLEQYEELLAKKSTVVLSSVSDNFVHEVIDLF